MDSGQIDLVQTSFAKIRLIADTAATLFYGRLFELDPSLKAMFKTNMQEQGRKLMQVLGVAVNSLTRLETILPTVQELGRGHVAYGVKDEHYPTVGAALLWTLEQALGDEFTTEHHEAWLQTYNFLADVMINAAAEVEQALEVNA